jgi:thioredoxin reductase (NADPH)
MAESAPPVGLRPSTPVDRIFPTLTAAQIARVARHGLGRSTRRGEVLIEAGDRDVAFFVVTAGQLEVVRPSKATETMITTHGPGQFTGEANMLSGRRGLARVRVAESGEVIVLNRERLLALMQTDSELGQIILRAFILRRVELIAQS